MKSVQIDGIGDPCLVKTDHRLLEVLTERGVPLTMACGGKGLCATCHVFVIDGGDNLSRKTPREERALKMLADLRPNSRLACQAKITGDGVRVSVPSGRYLLDTGDLGALVGRRAEEAILHPIDGRLLIAPGKIITRSRIQELRSVDIDVAEMKTRSLSIRRR